MANGAPRLARNLMQVDVSGDGGVGEFIENTL
jgi:hypothetical protein